MPRSVKVIAAAAGILLVITCGCEIVTPPPDRSGQVRVPWILYEAAGNRVDLGVMMGGTDCDRFEGVDVIESERSVEIQAWIERLPADGCFMVRTYHVSGRAKYTLPPRVT